MAETKRKEAMDGKKPSPDVDAVDTKPSVTPTWVQPRAQKELSSSEFLEFLRRQGEEGQFRNALIMTADTNFHGGSSNSHNTHRKDRNQDYQSVAIDQCDITSSVDYGSRDYYHPSSSTSAHNYKENEADETYKTCTDTRGNWWQGSFYY